MSRKKSDPPQPPQLPLEALWQTPAPSPSQPETPGGALEKTKMRAATDAPVCAPAPESGETCPALPAVKAPPVFTVSELIADVNQRLRAYGNQVWVEGELGQVGEKNGVYYFSLKDAKSTLECVLFQRHGQLPFELRQGMQVLVRGYLEIYPARGKFTLVIERIEPRGEGALLLAFLQLKKKLETEGLFDKQRRKLPLLPRTVAVVTSESGAALQDILKIARRRVGCRILISNCMVQGAAAPLSIVSALQLAESRPDVEVIILARGGGSMEDLACFNDELVVRAVHACKKPIVTAVGHQTDTTLVDYVSDVRAATPTEAAEMVFADGQLLQKRMETLMTRITRAVSLTVERARRQLAEARLPDPQILFNRKLREITDLQIRCENAVRRRQETARMRMDVLSRRLAAFSPQVRLLEQERLLRDAENRMKSAMTARIRTCADAMARMNAQLDALSPLAVLQRGYAVVTAPDGRFVRDAAQLSLRDPVGLRFARGSAVAVVEQVTPAGGKDATP